VRDEMDLSLKAGARERVWDSCQLEDFAMVAGGHSFRKERTDRQKHRFYRKFRYLMSKYGQPHCVGCGRCIRQCVAKINIVEMANELSQGVAAM
jgi:sulfhydrogenase subunit beta (sulfur reductase)